MQVAQQTHDGLNELVVVCIDHNTDAYKRKW
jgi:hypothetical protein